MQPSHLGLAALLSLTSVLHVPAFATTTNATISDIGSVYADLDANPNPGVGDVVVQPQALIWYRVTALGDAVNDTSYAFIEYDLAPLNPFGIFSARLVGEIAVNDATDTGLRRMGLYTYSGDGLVTANDLFETNIDSVQTITYAPPSETSTAVDVDVTTTVLDQIAEGASHLGLAVVPINRQAPSAISSIDPIQLQMEYYDNPQDALPPITGPTGFAFRGTANDWVTQGATESYTAEDGTNFVITRNVDNGLDISIDPDGVDYWHISLALAGQADPVAGLYENAVRNSFDNSQPQFEFTGSGRANSAVDCNFTIHEIVYDDMGNVLLLDLSFEQREPSENTFSVGRVMYNVPEPASVLLVASLAPMLLSRQRRR